MKKILIIFITFILCACNKNDNKLIMVTEAGFAPYEYYESNKIIGVDIEIAEEIAYYLGKELEVKDVAFDSIINELNSDKADFAAAGMSITEERKKEVDFSIEYITSKQIIISKNKNLKKEEIDNLKIAVQLGTTADFYLQDNYPNVKLVQQKKYLSALEDLKNDKVDCIVMDELPALELIKNYDNLYITDELFTDKYGMAVKKGNAELLDSINIVLNKLMLEGKIEQYIIEYTE